MNSVEPSLLQAEFISITFEFQKREEIYGTVTMHAQGDFILCPVRSQGSILPCIRIYPGTNKETKVNTIFTFVFGSFLLYGQGKRKHPCLLFRNWKGFNGFPSLFHKVYFALYHVFCTEVELLQNVSFQNIVFIKSQAIWERRLYKAVALLPHGLGDLNNYF